MRLGASVCCCKPFPSSCCAYGRSDSALCTGQRLPSCVIVCTVLPFSVLSFGMLSGSSSVAVFFLLTDSKGAGGLACDVSKTIGCSKKHLLSSDSVAREGMDVQCLSVSSNDSPGCSAGETITKRRTKKWACFISFVLTADSAWQIVL